eukprot:CAMPEP_0118857662 /NCGR_PEP_ID=MMETSP1163-20130328/4664_1 /TAXON_ID=124430 /ORGANISM="Phaeomonas parva, Strain CCMP2877" /LENGTH=1313 /DNA_ID=CAMNT_0006790999 /DNA_START=152 /DNA_END=4093 /DNA_ORIENTATION=-
MLYYYYATDGQQYGPGTVEDLQACFEGGMLDATCLVYGEGFADWITLGEIPDLMARLAPKPKPPPPPTGFRPPPPSLPKPKAAPAAPPLPQAAAAAPATTVAAAAPAPEPPAPKKPDEGVGFWTEKKTCDLVAYYYNTKTGALTWDCPDELKSEADASENAGNWAFIPDDEEGWVPARDIGGGNFQLLNGRTKKVKLKRGQKLLPLSYSSLGRSQSDLVLLDSLDEGLILHNLRERFKRNEIYTAIGGILIAVNPFKRLPLYSPERIEMYHKRGNKQMPPHPFLITSIAYNNILELQIDQSILVSGESGAGKTETTKQCLSFLAEVAGSVNNIEQRVLSANPILEAFGNAKTVRNDNSSRFGRFTEVLLDGSLRIAGAEVKNYLLEKSRVASQGPQERNYHIFYQMCLGAEAEQYGLTHPQYFNYLAQSGCYEVEGMDDVHEFEDVMGAFSLLGFEESKQQSIMSIVAGILHLGNVHFTPDTAGASDGSLIDPETMPSAQWAGREFGVDEESLQRALVNRTMHIRGQGDLTVPLRVEQALENRDALAKFVYDRLFDWLVERINASLRPAGGSAGARFIGILDIFGFEIFETNSFEQLCINFTNEKLQQLFNEDTFKNEEAVYRAEGVDFPPIEFIDNQPVVDLIEQRGGILTILDDIVRGPGKLEQKDAKLSQTLDKQFGPNSFFVPANQHRGLRGVTAFSVKHYAGQVCYNVSGFVLKNMDTLFPDLYELMSGASNGFVASLFPPKTEEGRKRTLGSVFKKSLLELMSKLRSTEPQYIRCVKPNPEKRAGSFSGGMCLEQLRYAGVFEAVRVRKNGYPFRYAFEAFLRRYKVICAMSGRYRPLAPGAAKDQATELIARTGQAFETMQVGRTMMLFRADEYRILELCRALGVERTSAKIQAIARGRLTRRYVRKVKAVVPKLHAALESKDPAQLDAALALVSETLGVFAGFSIAVPIGEWQACKDMREMLALADRLDPMLEKYAYSDLSEDNNFELLFKTLKDAQKVYDFHPNERFDYLYTTGREQFEGWREYRLKPRFEEAMDLLERDQMLELYAEAKRLEYDHPALKEIESLVGLSEEALLKRQYQRAQATNQTNRAMEKEIELKELYLDAHGGMFNFQQCSVLRTPDEYASVCWIGKEAAAANMRVWSDKPIVQSLTEIDDPKVAKAAVRTFKSMLGFAGDKRFAYPDTLVTDIIGDGIGDEDLRVDIFAMIMKQLTQNPNQKSADRYWALLMICLLHFPPGPALENYVHIFIRKHAPGPYKEELTRQCHKAAYVNVAASPPTAEMIPELLSSAGIVDPRAARLSGAFNR